MRAEKIKLNIFHRIPLSRDVAEKSRDNFSKRLYSLLFEKIVHIINKAMDFQISNTFIAVLDIAGFGKNKSE